MEPSGQTHSTLKGVSERLGKLKLSAWEGVCSVKSLFQVNEWEGLRVTDVKWVPSAEKTSA